MLINQLKDNTNQPSGIFYGDGRRYHGDNNQLIVLKTQDEKIGTKVDAQKLIDREGRYYPYGSTFG